MFGRIHCIQAKGALGVFTILNKNNHKNGSYLKELLFLFYSQRVQQSGHLIIKNNKNKRLKNIILLLAFSLLMLQLVAQPKTVNILGIVKDTAIKNIETKYLADANLLKWESKKLSVVNREFRTSLHLPFGTKMVIASGERVFSQSYIYSDVKIQIDSAGKVHILGSSLQDEYENEFLPFFRSNEKVYDSLMAFYRKFNGDFPKIVNDSVQLLREKWAYQRDNLLGEYIKLHPDSYIALWDIYYFVSIPASYKYFDLDKLLNSFSIQMQDGVFIKGLRGKITESNRMQAGQILPQDFFKGYEQMHNKIRNNCEYYLIDYWYSHCGPCIAGFPRLKEIYNRFHTRGFDIVSISIDQQNDELDYITAIKKHDLIWNHIWDKGGVVATKFNINSFPTYILLDKNDRIINNAIRVNELEEFLKERL